MRPSTRAEMGLALDVTGPIRVQRAARVITEFAGRPGEQQSAGSASGSDQNHYGEQQPTDDHFYGRPDDGLHTGSPQESAQAAEPAPPAGPRHYGDPTTPAEPHSTSPYADFVGPDDTQVIRPMARGDFPDSGDGFMPQR